MAPGAGFDYDPDRYPRFAVTVDVAIFTIRDDALHVLLIERGGEPFLGAQALPGGFVRPDEDLEQAAARELAEETGLTAGSWHLEQLAAYGAPDRDPRMRVVTAAYWAICADLPALRGGGDAAAAALTPVERIERGDIRLAFDHERIVRDAVERMRSRLKEAVERTQSRPEHMALAARFCPPEFTIGQLRRVCEAVLGPSSTGQRTQLDPGNFQRNVKASGAFEPLESERHAEGERRNVSGASEQHVGAAASRPRRGRPASLWSVSGSTVPGPSAAPVQRAPARRKDLARHRAVDTDGGTDTPRLPRPEYAALLYKAVGKYRFPTVTWDFREEAETRHESMVSVEERVGELLRSPDPASIRDGLSNVLYWGHARQPVRRDARVRAFRIAIRELDARLGRFAELAASLGALPAATGGSGLPAVGRSRLDALGGPDALDEGRSGLLALQRLKLPQFGQISFASKVLMFLDPARFPVLDLKIAREFGGGNFPPLASLRFGPGGIRITRSNADAYYAWARWCRNVAGLVNEEPASPRRDLRAVDVERALFTLVDQGARSRRAPADATEDAGAESNAWKARALLRGPAGATFDGE